MDLADETPSGGKPMSSTGQTSAPADAADASASASVVTSAAVAMPSTSVAAAASASVVASAAAASVSDKSPASTSALVAAVDTGVRNSIMPRYMKPAGGYKAWLVVDNYGAHLYDGAVSALKKNGVEFATLLPRTTYVAQPNDGPQINHIRKVDTAGAAGDDLHAEVEAWIDEHGLGGEISKLSDDTIESYSCEKELELTRPTRGRVIVYQHRSHAKTNADVTRRRAVNSAWVNCGLVHRLVQLVMITPTDHRQ